ncbi:uncharacterized protein LOC129803904 [Phlebotomus papatasi]|uniref:uncharacterized protein LOC129803904 n=1 Tax=Phlebotomus papatasi TaxID=29031 RepID=UPI002483A13F|nr:uncharacterized protein LOC129803904 [Phlebotomus papatasi]
MLVLTVEARQLIGAFSARIFLVIVCLAATIMLNSSVALFVIVAAVANCVGAGGDHNSTLRVAGGNFTIGHLRTVSAAQNASEKPVVLKVVNQTYSRNDLGEYTMSYTLNDGSRRVEVAEFEEVDGTKKFVIRGLFTYMHNGILRNVLYKSDDTGFYTYPDPTAVPEDNVLFLPPESTDECIKQNTCIDSKLLTILVG